MNMDIKNTETQSEILIKYHDKFKKRHSPYSSFTYLPVIFNEKLLDEVQESLLCIQFYLLGKKC